MRRHTVPAVPDASFFYAVAGISMSFVGFTGLINALRPRRDAWQPIEILHLNVTVLYAFATLFAALGAIPLAGLVGQVDALRSLGAAMLVVSVGLGIYQFARDRALGPTAGVPTPLRATFALLIALQSLLFLGAALMSSAPVYEVGLVLMLAIPALAFGYVLAQLRSGG